MPTLSTAGGERVAQRRLSTLADNLPQLDLEQEVDQAARLLRSELPTLPDYDALSPDLQAYYDVATGLRAAVSLLMPTLLRANDGLSKLKTPDYEFTFTVPSSSERQVWGEEIAQAMGYLIKFVQSLAPPSCRPRLSMFGAAGVARARARCEYSLAGLMQIYVPGQWFYDDAFSIIGPDEISLNPCPPCTE